MPRSDFTVAIEWSDGSKSVVDFRPDIAKGEALSYLREPAVFLHRLFVQSEGQSLAGENAKWPDRFSCRRALAAHPYQVFCG